MIDFAALAARLLSQSRSLLDEWLPAGRMHGAEFCVGDLSGNEGESLKININTGRWADFATGHAGGDLISLYAAIHNMSQGEAAKLLDPQATSAPTKGNKKDESWAPILPVPDDAPEPGNSFFKRGKDDRYISYRFIARWAYTDAQDRVLGYAVRFEWTDGNGEIHKDVVPQVYCASSEGKRQWRWLSMPTPRSLYNMREVVERSDAPVLLVEGEKCVEALRIIAPSYVGTTWPGGCRAWKKADWSALRGRKKVLLWPDADKDGVEAMWAIGHELLKRCAEVKIIIPEGVPVSWDAADALRDGWDWAAVREWALPLVKQIQENGDGQNNTESQGRANSVVQQQTQGQSADGVDQAQARSSVRELREVPSGEDAPHGDVRAPEDGEAGARPQDPGPLGRGTLPARQGASAGDRGATGSAASTSASPGSQIDRWLEWGLQRSGNGAPLANLFNAVRIIERDAPLKDKVFFDVFLQRTLTLDNGHPREWIDPDDLWLTNYMQDAMGVQRMGAEVVRQAVTYSAHQNKRNCVLDWLGSLPYDGEARVEQFFQRAFGAPDDEYTRAVSHNFWLSIVARVMRPGCKVDNMVVLEGAQGLLKSTALSIIGGEWFAEQHESATNPKAFAEVLQGKLVIEVSEMDSFTRSEVTQVKKTVSCQSDRFRAAYDRRAKDHPRQCVMVGTTNRDDWNRDDTGARRMWPIACKAKADVGWIAEQREQLFAEALARFKAGETWWLVPEAEAKIEQRKRREDDPWREAIAAYLVGRASTITEAVLGECLHIDLGKRTRAEEMRVASCLRDLGWVKGDARVGGKMRKVWSSPADLYGFDATSGGDDATLPPDWDDAATSDEKGSYTPESETAHDATEKGGENDEVAAGGSSNNEPPFQ